MKKTVALIALTLLSATSQTGLAQQLTSKLEEVIVSGDKLGRNQFDIDTSVAIFDAAELEQGTMSDIYEAFTRIANVNANFGNNGRTGGFVIRGITDSGLAQSFGTSSPLATIYVDDVPLSGAGNRAGPLDFWDVQSLEIFRGPQSTNQGKNALAGAIILRTAAPTDEWEMKLRMRAGSNNYTQFAGVVNAPLSGGFALRVAARDEQGDGDVRNITRNEAASKFDRQNRRYKLGFNRDESPLTALLTVTQSDVYQGQPQLTAPPERRESSTNSPEFFQVSSELTSLKLTWAESDSWQLTSIISTSAIDLMQFDDFNTSPEEDGTTTNFVVSDTQTAELRLNLNGLSLMGGEITGVVGGYYSRYRNDSVTTLVDGVVLDGVFLDGVISKQDDQKNYAVFTEFEWQILDNWSLTAGARYDIEDLALDYFSEIDLSTQAPLPDALNDFISDQVGPSAGLPSDSMGTDSTNTAAFLPKLGVRYSAQKWRAGATVQQAYRSGGVSANFARGTFSKYDPEYTNTLELFYRAELFDRKLTVVTNIYYTDWQSQQVPVQLSEDVNDVQTENAGQSTLSGYELELEAKFTENLTGFASWGQSFTEFKEFDSSAGDYSGNEFPSAPNKQGGAGLNYQAPYNFYAQLDVNYVEGSFRTAENRPDQLSDSYVIVNAKAGWRFSNGELYVSGRNLADEFYVTQRAFGFFQAGAGRSVEFGFDFFLGGDK